MNSELRLRPVLSALFCFLLLAGSQVACSGGASTSVTATGVESAETADPSENAAEQLVQAAPTLNTPFLMGGVTESHHGVDVADPFRSLELDADATWAWVEAQTTITDSYVAANANSMRAERLAALLGIGSYGDLAVAGERTFLQKRDGDHDQPVLYVIETPDATPRALVDPATLDGQMALDWYFPSPNGQYLAYGLSEGGSEQSVLHILDVNTGEPVDRTIAHAKWCSLTWRRDGAGFYYSRYPAEGEADYDAENVDTYFRHLFYHQLGTDPASDPRVFTAEQTDFVGSDVSLDDDELLVSVFHGWSESDVWRLDLTAADAEPEPVAVGNDFLIYGFYGAGGVLLVSNEDHPRSRILLAQSDALTDVSSWVEFVPESDGNLDSVYLTQDHLVVHYIENIASSLVLIPLDGSGESIEVDLPADGAIHELGTDPNTNRFVFSFDSFFYPPALYEHTWTDGADGQLSELDHVDHDIDPSGYRMSRETVTSPDGTAINVFLVHRTDLEHDGGNPVLLNGYGGFSVPMMPGFRRNTFYWLERGGVFALANIRGGGEFGEDWHQAGMLHNKINVFDDFEAVIRWLSDSNLSSPERIAIHGGSNGGLLMGAMLTRCPDAFRATVTSVGLYDMVRYHLFPPAEIWMSEYGDPDDADDFEYLLSYSPYHQVEDGTAYPSVLMETADRDTRVSWQHSTKFAAALQEASSSDHPILFHMSRDQGHGAGGGLANLVEEYVRFYTFIETELGVNAESH